MSPSEVPGPCVAAPPGLPRTTLPPMKFDAPRSLVCSRLAGLSGSPLPPRPRRFRRTLRYLTGHRPLRACTHSFILPRASRLLQSSATHDLPMNSRTALRPDGRHERLPWGSVPHRDISRRQATEDARGSQTSSCGASTTFRTSSTPCSAMPASALRLPPARPPSTLRSPVISGLAGLFHPAATSRVRPSGDCPSRRSRTGFPRPLPSWRSMPPPAV